MPLAILNVAYPLAPVGPDAVGGAEQVLTALDAALVRLGHHSVVIACEGSVAKGTLLTIPRPAGRLDPAARQRAQAQTRERIERALGDFAIDVLHLHGVDFDQYLPAPGVPTLVTLHLPPSYYCAEVFQLERPVTHLHCVSQFQHNSCPPGTPLLPPIPNGVEFAARSHKKRPFALALGRICPEKGFHLALDAAAQAGFPIVLAGQVFGYFEHEEYFNAQIVPRLGPSRRFIGPIGLRRKCRLLTAAACLLVPSLVPETSSLVAMEALACGTPVIAFPIGALPEIIEHGKTGFLVANEHEMARALRGLAAINPEDCRVAARTRFPLSRMLAAYCQTYQQLAGEGP